MIYENNIFINCPFDKAYSPLLKPLLFTVMRLGYTPRITLERFNSSEIRMKKIIECIKESKYGIHDLSRLKSVKKGEYFRLNMPFELGLDIGCREFGGQAFTDKKCLVLEKEAYRYQAALSDLSGCDIKSHKDSAERVCRETRNWLVSTVPLTSPPAPSSLWGEYLDFQAWMFTTLKSKKWTNRDIHQMQMKEYMQNIKDWMTLNPSPSCLQQPAPSTP